MFLYFLFSSFLNAMIYTALVHIQEKMSYLSIIPGESTVESGALTLVFFQFTTKCVMFSGLHEFQKIQVFQTGWVFCNLRPP